MNKKVIHVLLALFEQYGESLLVDKRKTVGLLYDVIGAEKKEIEAITSLFDCNLPLTMFEEIKSSNTPDKSRWLKTAVSTGLQSDSAQWGIQAWLRVFEETLFSKKGKSADVSISDIEKTTSEILYPLIPFPDSYPSIICDVSAMQFIKAHDDHITSMSVSPDGGYIATSDRKGNVQLRETGTCVLLRTFVESDEWIFSTCFSNDSRQLAYGGKKLTIQSLDSDTGDTLYYDVGSDILSLSFAPYGLHIAAGCADGVIRFWDIQTGRVVKTFRGHHDSVLSIDFSTDGKYLISGGRDSMVILWDVEQERLLHTYAGNKDWVYSVAFAPNSLVTASAGFDENVHVWSPFQGLPPATYKVHNNGVMQIRFDELKNYIVSAGLDSTIKIVHLAQQELVLTLRKNNNAVHAIALKKGSSGVFAGLEDGTILNADFFKVPIFAYQEYKRNRTELAKALRSISSKGEFEKSSDFEIRLAKESERLYKKYGLRFETILKQKLKEIDGVIKKSEQTTKTSLEEIALYNADTEQLPVKIDGDWYQLPIPLQEAATFKEYASKVAVLVKKRLNYDMTTYKILEISTIHPLTGSTFILKCSS